MPLSDHDRGKLEKAIDSTVSFAPLFAMIAHAQIGKEVLKISNDRDFVLGAAFAYVMLYFMINTSTKEFTQEETSDMYALILKRFFREIDVLKVPKSKAKKLAKRRARP